MSPRVPAVDPARLARWCAEYLGSPPAGELFRSGYLSAVIGFRLADDREVVVKVRPESPRIAACVEVQRRLFESGYPCPEPRTGAAPLGDDVATAETYVPGGAMPPSAEGSARAFADAFARLVTLAPRPREVAALDPSRSWAAWNHAEPGLWPHPEDGDVNLNEPPSPAWIDDAQMEMISDDPRVMHGQAVIAGDPRAGQRHLGLPGGRHDRRGDHCRVPLGHRRGHPRGGRLRCRAAARNCCRSRLPNEVQARREPARHSRLRPRCSAAPHDPARSSGAARSRRVTGSARRTRSQAAFGHVPCRNSIPLR